jgi:hypothetical protein
MAWHKTQNADESAEKLKNKENKLIKEEEERDKLESDGAEE